MSNSFINLLSLPLHPLSTEVELISLMDKNGIGTDATIATHISTIQSREYAHRDPQQKFHPTKLGIALVEGYNRYVSYMSANSSSSLFFVTPLF
jgi:DNA topoisomerase IA